MAPINLIVAHTHRPRAAKSGKMWTAIFERYVTDQVAFVVHAYLLGFAIFSTFVVACGIVWESDAPLGVHPVARRLVIWGVAAEAIFTVALFVFDEGISSAQKSKIEETTEELVAYRRQRLLTQGQKDRIARVTKDFPSVTFVAYMVPEQEPWTLVLDIATALRAGGWDWKPVPGGLQPIDRNPSEGVTIADHVVVVAPSELREAAEALKVALTDRGGTSKNS
jgi:hypothetical protein